MIAGSIADTLHETIFNALVCVVCRRSTGGLQLTQVVLVVEEGRGKK